MNSNYPKDCDALYAAIGLTSQKTCHSLTQFMINWMQLWEFVDSISVFEVYLETDNQEDSPEFIFRRFTDDITAARIVSDEPGLDDCAFNRVPTEIKLNQEMVRLVFPISSNSGPLRLVCMDGTIITPEERVLFMHLLTLYKNQVNLLDEKERDVLTGLLNRQTFDMRLIQISRILSDRNQQAFLAELDIDHFKQVNDTYGHLFGDEVLLRFSQIMERYFRYTDFLFRFGGEEFIVLLNNTNAKGASEALERFRKAVEEYNFPSVGKVTVSTGYVDIRSNVLPTTLVDRADKALYHAKENGRNQIVYYNDIRPDDDDIDSDIELF